MASSHWGMYSRLPTLRVFDAAPTRCQFWFGDTSYTTHDLSGRLRITIFCKIKNCESKCFCHRFFHNFRTVWAIYIAKAEIRSE